MVLVKILRADLHRRICSRTSLLSSNADIWKNSAGLPAPQRLKKAINQMKQLKATALSDIVTELWKSRSCDPRWWLSEFFNRIIEEIKPHLIARTAKLLQHGEKETVRRDVQITNQFSYGSNKDFWLCATKLVLCALCQHLFFLWINVYCLILVIHWKFRIHFNS